MRDVFGAPYAASQDAKSPQWAALLSWKTRQAAGRKSEPRYSIFWKMECESTIVLTMLKRQDIVVLLKLAAENEGWTFDSLAEQLSMSVSAVHRSLSRAAAAGLYEPANRHVAAPALLEFLVHSVKYLFPPSMGGEARGIPTAWAAPPLSDLIASSGNGAPVWPDPRGSVRGIAMEPIHPKAPAAARKDPMLGEMLALVDAVRLGDVRQRDIAASELASRLKVEPANR